MPNAEETALLARLDEVSTQFQHGDDSGMEAFYADRDDVTLFGALGGCARGRESVEKVLQGAARNLAREGTARYEVVTMQIEGTLAYVVGVDRIEPAAEGLADLRVTNIFRKEQGEWRLMHRHADAFRESPFA
jgi:ketosteroid isomerase-like protein